MGSGRDRARAGSSEPEREERLDHRSRRNRRHGPAECRSGRRGRSASAAHRRRHFDRDGGERRRLDPAAREWLQRLGRPPGRSIQSRPAGLGPLLPARVWIADARTPFLPDPTRCFEAPRNVHPDASGGVVLGEAWDEAIVSAGPAPSSRVAMAVGVTMLAATRTRGRRANRRRGSEGGAADPVIRGRERRPVGRSQARSSSMLESPRVGSESGRDGWRVVEPAGIERIGKRL